MAYLPFDDTEVMPGAELAPEREAALRRAAHCYRAERAALRFIARAEQSRFALERKLNRQGIGREECAAALDYLEGLEIISDERYATVWLRMKLRPALGGRKSGVSPRKLFAVLTGRGIAAGTARKALREALDAGTEAALLKSWIAAGFPAAETGEGGDAARFALRAEGFSAAAIRAWAEERE
jgi:regulatory protein